MGAACWPWSGGLSEERPRRVQGRGDVTMVQFRPIVPGELAQPAWAVRHIAEEK